ncbi:MAG: hypothetical protein OXH98_13860 [Caldilineaceae bacterium]|nr:hypothetical protein [Caldilineaceae bacterium]
MELYRSPDDIDLSERGIDESLAAEMRARLATFAEDRDAPEMDTYDTEFESKPEESAKQAASAESTGKDCTLNR